MHYGSNHGPPTPIDHQTSSVLADVRDAWDQPIDSAVITRLKANDNDDW